jgi:hypothetical protein
MGISWGNIGGEGGSSDISETYVTLDPLTTVTTVASGGSVVIPVNATGGSFAVTLNDNVPVNTRARIHDSYEQCGTNPVTIKNGSDVVIGKLNTDGGAVEFAWTGANWMKIDRFENMLDRDEVTGEVKLREPLDTFVAGKMRTPVENLAGSVAGGGFTNADVNVDVGSGDFGNGFESGAEPFNDGSYNTDDSTPFVVTASVETTVARGGWAAFDSSEGSFWVSDNDDDTHFVQIDLGATNPKLFTELELRTRITTEGTIAEATILASDNGVDYDEVGSFSGQTASILSVILNASKTYRYYRIEIPPHTSPNGTFLLYYLKYYEGVSYTTGNTIESTSALGSGSLIPSTLVLNDENALPISGAGKVNVAYAVDGGAFSSLVDLETFRADPTINYTSQFQLRFQAVGSQRVSSYSIEAPATYSEMTQDGMETYVDGSSVGKLTKDGIEPLSLTTADRDLLSPSGIKFIHNSTTNKMNFYNGSSWEELTSS